MENFLRRVVATTIAFPQNKTFLMSGRRGFASDKLQIVMDYHHDVYSNSLKGLKGNKA